jgi:hypothetical protein
MSTCATHRLLSVALLLGCSRGDAPGGAKRGAESTPDSGGEVGDGGADGSGCDAEGSAVYTARAGAGAHPVCSCVRVCVGVGVVWVWVWVVWVWVCIQRCDW